jgi:hypothetical protein
MKKFTIFSAVSILLMLPLFVLAQSYHYIALSGEVKTIEAEAPSQALAIAHQNGAAPDSGVKLDSGTLETGEIRGGLYQYVDVRGILRTITAASVETAFMLAFDRAHDSGVLYAGPAPEE